MSGQKSPKIIHTKTDWVKKTLKSMSCGSIILDFLTCI